MAKHVPVIDSSGQFTRRKRAWVEKHEQAGNGTWKDGTFVFHRTCSERSDTRATMRASAPAAGAPGTRAASLMGQQWAQRDLREFPIDTHFWDGRAVLKFWGDQGTHGKPVQPEEGR
jgi:hypothetical protein